MTPSLTTTALNALSRLDDGTTLAGDRVLADMFDQHCRRGAQRFCLICGGGNGPECTTCTAAHDKAVDRSGDL